MYVNVFFSKSIFDMERIHEALRPLLDEAFSPVIAVLTSVDAETICHKNNTSFTELITPFCRFENDGQLLHS